MSTLREALDTLQEGLLDVAVGEPGPLELRPLRRALGDEAYDELSIRVGAYTVLAKLDVVAAFLLQVVDAAGVGESIDDLLRAPTDVVNRLREFPHLAALSTVLQPGSDRRPGVDVVARFLERFASAQHESSPRRDVDAHRLESGGAESSVGEAPDTSGSSPRTVPGDSTSILPDVQVKLRWQPPEGGAA